MSLNYTNQPVHKTGRIFAFLNKAPLSFVPSGPLKFTHFLEMRSHYIVSRCLTGRGATQLVFSQIPKARPRSAAPHTSPGRALPSSGVQNEQAFLVLFPLPLLFRVSETPAIWAFCTAPFLPYSSKQSFPVSFPNSSFACC